MKGTIYHANTTRSMYSAQLSDGSFSVFELIDTLELNQRTEVHGDLDQRGDREITMNDDTLHIHVDHYGLDEMAAFQRTFLRD